MVGVFMCLLPLSVSHSYIQHSALIPCCCGICTLLMTLVPRMRYFFCTQCHMFEIRHILLSYCIMPNKNKNEHPLLLMYRTNYQPFGSGQVFSAGLRSRSRSRSRPESVVLTGVGVGVGKFSSTPTPVRSRSRLQHFFMISFLVKMETKMET